MPPYSADVVGWRIQYSHYRETITVPGKRVVRERGSASTVRMRVIVARGWVRSFLSARFLDDHDERAMVKRVEAFCFRVALSTGYCPKTPFFCWVFLAKFCSEISEVGLDFSVSGACKIRSLLVPLIPLRTAVPFWGHGTHNGTAVLKRFKPVPRCTES